MLDRALNKIGFDPKMLHMMFQYVSDKIAFDVPTYAYASLVH